MSDEDIYDASPPRARNLEVRNKGKRVSDSHEGPSATRRRIRDPSPPNPDANGDLDEYDPAQSMQERRQIQRKLRDMQREMRENPDQFMQDKSSDALINYFDQSDTIMRDVKQTNEATIDSRGLVFAADLSARRVQRLTSGNIGNGIDVDEFVSKCITYMRHGRGFEDDDAPELTSTQRHRRRRPGRAAADTEDEEDMGDEGDMLNWPHLGRYAAVPSVRRPALPGFLSGPLSIEKKVRRMTQRNAPFKINSLIEVRPQELRAEDLKKSDKNDLPSICKNILEQLENKQNAAQDAVESLLNNGEVDDPEQEFLIMEKYALHSSGGIDLLRFVINPRSFGQTVENMFYVSFLLREGGLKLEFDSYGRPSLSAHVHADEHEKAQGRHGTTRHQAIMSIDMDIWKDIIDAYNIKEPMIDHREEESQQGPGAQGWYS
ncbi:Nse4 C-terminal-domain-containing protein [Neurospora hispaniola]|uniref:Non-structural maintenance of chromosomes element 4 n=1 Tax=Neurospora hispaniola TaxID=588809 RepID=A0AAJ0MU08_9PEZI|nr:Nse4 C-terminal-domain-containing protein [Neurospora hispaniola]